MKKLSLTLGWLYPTLMNTYGDRGNIIALEKRCKWRGIHVSTLYLDEGFSNYDLEKCDLLFMGGAQDKQQKIVAKDFAKKTTTLSKMIENNIPGLYICGAYQFLGKYYKEADGTIIKGLEILDVYTENPGENHSRLIGNMVVDISNLNLEHKTLVGFENHGGRTYLGEKVFPLGRVQVGFGNNGKDKTEGAVYKNSFGSYSHGPMLPKNPHFADYLIKKALEKKYDATIDLKPLDDSMEWQAHEEVLKKLNVR